MKLHSITLENYRVHKSLSVEFDDQRNLIGGHNETGKSTLVEAAHRVLFLRYKTGGEPQKQMVSTTGTGHPKVTLQFSLGEEIFTIEKEFRGQNGSALLSNHQSGETWTNDEAENKLRDLLQVENYGSGSAFKSQWSHLWITQGTSGENPSEEASHYANELLQRLETEGASALQQSAQDQAVAEHFAEKYALHYTATGRPRINSPASDAGLAVEQTSDILNQAQANLQVLEESRRAFIQADLTREELVPKLATYTEQLNSLDQKLNIARTHQDLLVRTNETHACQKRELEELDKKDRIISVLSEQFDQAKKEFEASSTSVDLVKSRLETARKNHAQFDPNSLRGQISEARILVDFCQQQVATLEQEEILKHLATSKQKLIPLRDKLAKQKAALAQFNTISEKEVAAIFQLETQLKSTREQLDTISTRIEIDSPYPVSFGDGTAITETALTISRHTELRVGDPKQPTIVKIAPGGSEGLQKVETNIRQLQENLEAKLHESGFPTALAARDSRAKQETIEAELKNIEREIFSLGGEDLLARHQEATEKLEQHRTLLQQLVSRFKTAPSNAEDITEARDRLSEAQANLANLSEQDEALHKQSAGAKDSLIAAETDSKKHHAKHEQLGRKLLALKAKYETLTEEHGNKDTRKSKLEKSRSAQLETQREIQRLEKKLTEINPRELRREQTRLSGALETTRTAISETETQKAVAQNQLSKTSDRDPVEVLAEAEAAHSRAKAESRRMSNQAKAHLLLHRLFQDEKKVMADQLTAPLCDRVEDYLKPIFGDEVSVSLEYGENNSFQSLALARNGNRFDFSSLSGGTREQLAAAFRLALAEILSEDHDGSLPLVFDDSFTNSDPERVGQLQSMLDIAAKRGLQLILLSCSPNQYAALGAKQTILGKQ